MISRTTRVANPVTKEREPENIGGKGCSYTLVHWSVEEVEVRDVQEVPGGFSIKSYRRPADPTSGHPGESTNETRSPDPSSSPLSSPSPHGIKGEEEGRRNGFSTFDPHPTRVDRGNKSIFRATGVTVYDSFLFRSSSELVLLVLRSRRTSKTRVFSLTTSLLFSRIHRPETTPFPRHVCTPRTRSVVRET